MCLVFIGVLMPGRFLPCFIYIFWGIFFVIAFVEQWSERGKSTVTASRLFSTKESLTPRVESITLDSSNLGDTADKINKSGIISTFPMKTTSETNIRFSVTIDSTTHFANGQIVYNAFDKFSYATIEWKVDNVPQGFIAIRKEGQLTIEPVGDIDFEKIKVPFYSNQTFSIDPTMAVAVPQLRVGETWVINSFLGAFLKMDLQLKAEAKGWVDMDFNGVKRNVMEVEVGTFGSSTKQKVFTSWVTVEGVVLKSVFQLAGIHFTKEFVKSIELEKEEGQK